MYLGIKRRSLPRDIATRRPRHEVLDALIFKICASTQADVHALMRGDELKDRRVTDRPAFVRLAGVSRALRRVLRILTRHDVQVCENRLDTRRRLDDVPKIHRLSFRPHRSSSMALMWTCSGFVRISGKEPKLGTGAAVDKDSVSRAGTGTGADVQKNSSKFEFNKHVVHVDGHIVRTCSLTLCDGEMSISAHPSRGFDHDGQPRRGPSTPTSH